MPSGYTSRVSGVDIDFDDLFDPYVTGTPPAATGYDIAGVGDLAGRYAPLIFGTQRADVGYAIESGADVATLWAARGTATYVSLTAGLPDTISSYVNSPSGPLTVAADFTMNPNGSTAADEGFISAWYPFASPGVGDLYDVEFTVLGGFGGTLTGSTLGVRLPLSSVRGLTLTVTRVSTGSGVATRSVKVDIRRIGQPAILGAQTIAIAVEADIS